MNTFRHWLKTTLPLPNQQTLFQEILGYCLHPELNLHRFFLLHGPAGSGKSTALELIAHIVSPYLTLRLDLDDFRTFAPRPHLETARLWIVDGVSFLRFKDQDTVKRFISAEPIPLERKGRDPLCKKPHGRLLIASSSNKAILDPGMHRRCLALEFTEKFAAPNLVMLEKLRMETFEIAAWADEGAARLHDRGSFSDL